MGVAAFDLGRFGERSTARPQPHALRTSRRATIRPGRCLPRPALHGDRPLRGRRADPPRRDRRLRRRAEQPRAPRLPVRALGRLYSSGSHGGSPTRTSICTQGARRPSRLATAEPLVQGHWAELLLAEGTPRGEAEAVLEAAETFGWAAARSLGSLRARVALAEGRLPEAVASARARPRRGADRDGQVTAVRSEEILSLTRAYSRPPDPATPRVSGRRGGVVGEKAESL